MHEHRGGEIENQSATNCEIAILQEVIKCDRQRDEADDASDDADRDERGKRIGEQREEFSESDVERIAGRVGAGAPRIEFLHRRGEEQLVAFPECFGHRGEARNQDGDCA